MSIPEVRLSTIDRVIGVSTAVNTYKLRKLTEQILLQQNKTNIHLQELKRQMSLANDINRQILGNQLKEEENKAVQKYYKALSFYLFETIDLIRMIEDKMVLNYVMIHFYDKVKSNIIEANDQLDEINDKAFNKQALDKLNEIKSNSDLTLDNFKLNVLYKIDNIISDFKIRELRISSIEKPNFINEKYKRKRTNNLRTFGIVILGLISFVLLLFGFVASLSESKDYLFALALFLFLSAPFGIPFVILLVKELKWRKEFDDFYKDQIKKRQEFEKNKIGLEQQYQDETQMEKEKLLDHPLYGSMVIINQNHPTFEKTVSDITELEKVFAKKWGLNTELSLS